MRTEPLRVENKIIIASLFEQDTTVSDQRHQTPLTKVYKLVILEDGTITGQTRDCIT